MSKPRRWILGALAAVAATLIVILILFDWNWLKGPIESQVSAALGRPFRVAGDLDVALSLEPRITIEGAELANASWGSDAPMAKVDRAEVVVDVLKLLQGEIVLPEVGIIRPDLLLETRPDGPPNWQFGTGEPSGGLPPVPTIGSLEVSDASIRYHDLGSEQSITAELTRIAGSTGSPEGGLKLNATGRVHGEPLDLDVTGAPLARLENRAEPYSASLALKLGESDLTGDLTVDLWRDMPAIGAKLASDHVKTTDFTSLIAARSADDAALASTLDEAQRELEQAEPKAGGPSGKLDLFDPSQLPAINIDLQYSIGRLEGPALMLQDVSLNAGLHDRLPSLRLTGSGRFRGQPVVLDVQAGPAEGEPQPGAAYSLDANIEAGDTKVTANGVIADPQQLEGLDLRFELRSPDLSEVLRQLGVKAPQLPQIKAAGNLLREDRVWKLADAYAEVGESNVSGQVSADLSQPRPFISADLQSERLRVRDLVATSEQQKEAAQRSSAGSSEQTKREERQRSADEKPASDAEAPAPLLTAAGVNFDAIPKIDADVQFRGGYVEAPEARLERLQLDLKLRDQVIVMDATGKGRFREREPVTFEVHAGTEESLENPDARYPLDVSLEAGNTKASAKGTVDQPLNYTGLDVDVALQGPDLDELGEFLELPLPATPPYKLAAKVTHQEQEERWNLVALRGEAGDSDIEGDVSLELGGQRPTVVADLKSKSLDLDDLGVLVGAPPGTGPGETAAPEQAQQAAQETAAGAHVLPDKPLDVPELRAVDARVSFTGESIQVKKVPLHGMHLKFTLKDGRMRFDPLRFDLADGHLEGLVGLEGRSGVLTGDLDLALRNIKLNQLLSRFNVDFAQIEMEKEGAGTFGGQAKLTVKGKSIHDLAASANGELAMVMGGGQINALIIEALGLDAGEILAVLVTGEEEKEAGMVPVQCFVSRFDIQDGVMKTKALVLETSDSTVTGSGTIDLGKEAVDLRLLAHPKDASVLTASTPVGIKGTFREPKLDVVSEELEEKGLAALALGAVLPVIGAIFPFIETGEAEGVNCAALMKAAKEAGGMHQSNTSANQDNSNAN